MCDTFFDWDGETQRRLYKSQNCFYNILYIFQFHRGSIKTLICPVKYKEYQYFNSIKVRLRHDPRVISVIAQTSFNSIKVRLRLCYQFRRTEKCVFQFHKGSIKTFAAFLLLINQHCCFNSIKVRLRPDRMFYGICALWFQFHKGSIKTYTGPYPSHLFLVSIP